MSRDTLLHRVDGQCTGSSLLGTLCFTTMANDLCVNLECVCSVYPFPSALLSTARLLVLQAERDSQATVLMTATRGEMGIDFYQSLCCGSPDMGIQLDCGLQRRGGQNLQELGIRLKWLAQREEKGVRCKQRKGYPPFEPHFCFVK